MSALEKAIEQAARIIDPDGWRLRDSGTLPLDHPGAQAVVRHSLETARALADAGLINGFRPGRWWRVMGPDRHLWAETSSEHEARERMRPGDRLYRQWETERSTRWELVDAVDRAEGDGRAE